MIKGGDRVVGGFKFKSKWEQKMRKKKKKGRYQKSNAPLSPNSPFLFFWCVLPLLAWLLASVVYCLCTWCAVLLGTINKLI